MPPQPVTEFLLTLLRSHPEVTALHLFSPPTVPTLQNRLTPTPLTDSILAAATALRAATSLPFWDAVNVSSFHRHQASPDLLAAALFHNLSGPPRQRVPLAGLTAETLQHLCLQREGSITALSSLVELADGTTRHIPMLDFHCPASDENLPLVTAAAQALHPHGHILQSGKSYHFYGATLLTDHENRTHLARALLLAPIIDRAWIAHQLLEGSCGLRLSAREERHIPYVAATF